MPTPSKPTGPGKQPKKIDLTNLEAKEMEELNALVKKLSEREKLRFDDPLAHQSAHKNDHRSV